MTSSATSSARDTILAVLDTLEDENEQLKHMNTRIQTELDNLDRENQRLRHELQQMRNERSAMTSHLQQVEESNKQLCSQVESQQTTLNQEAVTISQLRDKLSEERVVNTKQVEDLKNLILQREESVKRAEREVDSLRNRLERAARKNYSDRDIELLHEVEMLKEEKRDLSLDNQQLGRVNKKLKTELSNLQTIVDERGADLKNESRRHSLLTKEFNSLLDENNRLKLQNRRKSTQNNMLGGGGGGNLFGSPSLETFEESVHDLSRDNSHSTLNPKNSSRSSSQLQLPKQPLAGREPSLIINNEVFQPTRDYPFSSSAAGTPTPASVAREKTRIPGMTSREPSLVRRGGNFSVREGKRGGRPSAAKSDDRTTPDTLPSLASAATTTTGASAQPRP